MSPSRTTALTGAVVLALASPAAHAQTNKQLKKEIDELRKQVQALIELTKTQAAVAPPVAAAPEPAAPAVAAASVAVEQDQATRDAATPASQADVQGIRADLENYKYEQSRTAERNRASVTRNTKIGGTVQVRASWFNPAVPAGQGTGATGGNTTAQATGRQTSFDIPAATLSFAGNLYRDYAEGKNLTYQLGFTTASNFTGNPNTATSATRTLGAVSANGSQFNMTNANLTYSFEPTNGGSEDRKGALTIGQQQVPFGLEAQTTEEIRPVITSAQFTSALSGINTRQIGLIYRGDAFIDVDWTNNYRTALIEYAFGVVNGSGPNKSDNNGKKDWLGRVAFTLPADYNSWWRELKLGVSLYHGYSNLANTTTGSVVRIGKSRRTGFDINYTHLPFSIAYEYAKGDD
ncbi:MAG: porin, partial [Rhizobacter sp.]